MVEKINDPMALFERWFVIPLCVLKENLKEGDGAFVAMMVTLPLYERLLKNRVKKRDGECSDGMFNAEVCADMGITEEVRKRFWAIFRVGMMHQAMPQAGKTYWEFSHVWDASPRIENRMGIDIICIDPWKFADRILDLCKREPESFLASESFPFASVHTMNVWKV